LQHFADPAEIPENRISRRSAEEGREHSCATQNGSPGSRTGNTTNARLLAAETADDFATEEIDATDCTPARLKDIERTKHTQAAGCGVSNRAKVR